MLYVIVTLSSCEEVFEQDLSGSTVVLLSPPDSMVTSESTQVFYWEPVAAHVEHQLQVVSPDFDSIVQLVADTAVWGNQVVLVLHKGRQYQWRVRGINNSTRTPFSFIRTLWVE